MARITKPSHRKAVSKAKSPTKLKEALKATRRRASTPKQARDELADKVTALEKTLKVIRKQMAKREETHDARVAELESRCDVLIAKLNEFTRWGTK